MLYFAAVLAPAFWLPFSIQRGRLDLPGHCIVIPVATWAAHMLIRSLASDAGACAIFAFLLAWNDYLVVLVFIKSSNIFTLPIGVQGFFQQNATDWGSVMACLVVMLLPSAIIFAVFNKYFSVGGIGGSTRWALTSSVDQKGQPECRENIKIGPNPAALGADACRLRSLGAGPPDRLLVRSLPHPSAQFRRIHQPA